jgi:hypothetical protein
MPGAGRCSTPPVGRGTGTQGALGPVVTFPSSPGGRPRARCGSSSCRSRCVLSPCRAQTLVLDVLGSAPGAARVRAWRREADGNVTTGPTAVARVDRPLPPLLHVRTDSAGRTDLHERADILLTGDRTRGTVRSRSGHQAELCMIQSRGTHISYTTRMGVSRIDTSPPLTTKPITGTGVAHPDEPPPAAESCVNCRTHMCSYRHSSGPVVRLSGRRRSVPKTFSGRGRPVRTVPAPKWVGSSRSAAVNGTQGEALWRMWKCR